MKEVSRLLYIRRLTMSPYQPSCNGLIKKFNGTLRQMLRRLCHEQPHHWHCFINPLLFAYRKARQYATKFPPFELLYERIVRSSVQILKELWSKEKNVPEDTINYQYVLVLWNRLDETIKLVQVELERNQIRTKNCIIGKQRKEYFKWETKFCSCSRLIITKY